MNSRIMPSDLAAFTRPRLPRRRAAHDEGDTVDVRALLRTVWRRKLLVLAFMIGAGLLAWLATSQVAPTYTALSKVMLDPRKAQVVTNDEVVADLDLSEQVVNGEAAVIRSNVLIGDVIDRIGFEAFAPVLEPPTDGTAPEAHREALVWAVRRDLTVYREGESYVIGISVESPDPTLAATLANTLAETYIASQVESGRQTTAQATELLTRQVDTLRGQVAAAETAVARYRAENLTADGASLDTVSRQLAELNAELVDARNARVTAAARIDQLRVEVERGCYEAVASLVTSPLVERLVGERIDLVRQDQVWAERYDERHPERTRIRGELRQLDTDLEAEIQRIIAQRESERAIAQVREDALEASIVEMEEQILLISENALGLRQLERESAAKRAAYETLLNRLTETRTLEQLQQPDAKLIERATVPGAPSAPRPKLMGAIGAVLGGVLGLGLVFFLEMTAQTFRSAREIEAETGLPVLAQLPHQPWTSLLDMARALAKDPYSVFGERLRHLRTALLMRDGQDVSRAILVMSSAPGEGKSSTAVALAQMAAMAGRTAIVVDADLRRSTLQKAFGWEMEEDFADFIDGKVGLDRAIYSDPDFGFDMLAATGPQQRAADKLSVSWLKPVIDELKRVYDVVVIDAPALLAVSDALVLAQVADTRIYLVRWDGTPRSAVAEGLDALEEMGLSVAGVVLTQVDPDRSPDAYGEGYRYA